MSLESSQKAIRRKFKWIIQFSKPILSYLLMNEKWKMPQNAGFLADSTLCNSKWVTQNVLHMFF